MLLKLLYSAKPSQSWELDVPPDLVSCEESSISPYTQVQPAPGCSIPFSIRFYDFIRGSLQDLQRLQQEALMHFAALGAQLAQIYGRGGHR
jgi:hypothetical protein